MNFFGEKKNVDNPTLREHFVVYEKISLSSCECAVQYDGETSGGWRVNGAYWWEKSTSEWSHQCVVC